MFGVQRPVFERRTHYTGDFGKFKMSGFRRRVLEHQMSGSPSPAIRCYPPGCPPPCYRRGSALGHRASSHNTNQQAKEKKQKTKKMSAIHIVHVNTKEATLKKRFGENVYIADVTSRSKDPVMRALSPFHVCPVYSLDVPFSVKAQDEDEAITTVSVEAAWQGLKCFSESGICTKMMYERKVCRKRKCPSSETILGHCLPPFTNEEGGVSQNRELLGYVEARKRLYLPLYKQALDKCPSAKQALEVLREVYNKGEVVIVLKDFTTNGDVENAKTALSHASLVRARLMGEF